MCGGRHSDEISPTSHITVVVVVSQELVERTKKTSDFLMDRGSTHTFEVCP